MKTCAFSSPMEVNGGAAARRPPRFAGDLPHGHGGKAAAQRQPHGGLHNPFPSRIPL
jgi:hypothetical protein